MPFQSYKTKYKFDYNVISENMNLKKKINVIFSTCNQSSNYFRLITLITIWYSSDILSINLFDRDANKSSFENNYYLKMSGIIQRAKNDELEIVKIIEGAEIIITDTNNILIKKLKSNKVGACVFEVPLNNRYIITVSKEGWITKIINVDTKLSAEKIKNYQLFFDIEMYEDIKTIDLYLLKEPVADVIFNEYLNNFDYNFRHTHEVNKKIKKIYSDYYKLHK